MGKFSVTMRLLMKPWVCLILRLRLSIFFWMDLSLERSLICSSCIM